MTEERLRKIVIGSMLIMCVALVFGIVKLHLKYAKERQEAHLVETQMIEEPNEEIEDKDIENKDKEINIPAIEKPKNIEKKEDIDNKEKVVEEEVYEEIEGEKVPVRPVPKPQTNNLPEGMEKPNTPTETSTPQKSTDTEKVDKKHNETDKPKDKEKPSNPKKEEPKVVEGGTGSDGVIRDLNGNPLNLKPAEKIDEVKGSDLLDPGEVAGEGDKF
ncbi:hypothetical protein ACR77J_13965 [Tissierella praeacuta]|uniref:hypothetical protein n=1 Tax=Tissierella praeacuta TaxID=43131 RepID=UPI003DA2E008